MRKILIILLLVLGGCSSSQIDSYAVYNFTQATSIYNVEVDYSNVESSFAKGDAALIEARINKEKPTKAIRLYQQALEETEDNRTKALLYETLGSITGKNKYYYQSYKIWKELGNQFRATIDWNLYKEKDIAYEFEEYELKNKFLATPKEASELSIGENYFFIEADDILVSQVDRVTRDWLSSQLQDPDSDNLLTVFSEGYDIENIGWHEGGRIKQYLDIVEFEHKPVTGTVVRKINGKWYAPNEEGVFMFEVPVDKVQYPTTRFMRDDVALIIDTHGVNMLVEQAIKENATIVMGCCDHPGKIKAALYLNEKGIKVICNTDKYLPMALGLTTDTFGSVPFYDANNKVRIGYQPILINLNETIIVLNAIDDYGLTYYSTPYFYFSELKHKTLLPLNTMTITIDGYGQLARLTAVAEHHDAHVIAARVYNEEDYNVLKEWVEEDKNNRVILFHSEPYPYGYKLYREYAQQVAFNDIMPKFY